MALPTTGHAESLPFLLSQVGARSAQLFAERIAPLGVTPRAYGVLSYLAETASQTQQQLATALGIHRNNMVGLIDEMEAAGWVRRHRSKQDRRAFDIRLTMTGSTLIARVNRVLPALEGDIAHGLSDDDRLAMVASLMHIARRLDLKPGVHPHLRSPSR